LPADKQGGLSRKAKTACCADPAAMDGVAVTPNCSDLSSIRSVAGWLAVGVLLCAPAGLAQAQFSAPNNVQNAAPAAPGPAPSGGAAPALQTQKPAAIGSQSAPSAGPAAVTLPPQPPAPQIGSQGASLGSNPGPNQAPAQAATQAPVQADQGPDKTPAQAVSLPAAPDEKRGFLNGLGQWWDDSIANFNAKMKEQQAKLEEFNKQQSEAAKDATKAMKNAADAMFTPAKIIETQERCPVAGNGAPDCEGAAANFCKAKGFSDGHPMDIRTAERCKASLWVSGQTPTAADCPIETVLLRIACQP
jgi:hypothetical protein